MRYVEDNNEWFIQPTPLYFSNITKKIAIQVTALDFNYIIYTQPLLIS